MTLALARTISNLSSILLSLSLLVVASSAVAQSADPRRPLPSVDIAAAKLPQCTQVGTKLIAMLLRDDVRGALDFQQFYNTFNCPTNYLTRSFGCAITHRPQEAKTVDGKPPENQPVITVAKVIDACWDNPEKPKVDSTSSADKPAPASAAAKPPASPEQKKPPSAYNGGATN